MGGESLYIWIYIFSGGWGRLGRVSGWVGLGFLFAEMNEMGRDDGASWLDGKVWWMSPLFSQGQGGRSRLKETLFTLLPSRSVFFFFFLS